MSEHKYNNIQIADNIIFSEDINGVIIDGEENVLKGHEYDLLLCLVKAKGRVVSQDTILKTVWGPEYDAYYYADYIKNPLKRLRKQLGDDKRKIILTVKNTGYKLNYYSELDPIDDSNFKLPIVLSRRTVPYSGDDTIIFRDVELARITESIVSGQKNNLLLHGFGGVGKTSLARLIYGNIKDEYDSTGWIEYHENLKNSIVEGVDFDEIAGEIKESPRNIEEKWLYISKLMNNTKEKKLLVIDNVDVDYEIDQDPHKDLLLTEITGWTNTDIILTSRLPDIRGYHSIQIDNLGDRDDCEKCIALFYHYYGGPLGNKNHEVVRKIVTLAGFNTMIIELLAKSCVYEDSIESYYEKLDRIGFTYPSISVMTMHEDEPNKAVDQIAGLFSLRKRKNIEKTILVVFRLLPEGESISRYELEQWLGFPISSIDALVREGWITYKDGSFRMHPLIRQSVSLTDDLTDKCKHVFNRPTIREEGCSTALMQIWDQTFFNDEDGFELGLRKLKFADSIYCLSERFELGDAVYIADYARKLGRRDLATKYYKYGNDIASDIIADYDIGDLPEKDYLIWKTIYYYGYLLSYTRNGLKSAEELLRRSLDIALSINSIHMSDRSEMITASSYDHLGYVLYNDHQNNIDRMREARECLETAIDLRSALCEIDPENIRYLHDLAWSQDNIGCMLTKMYEEFFDADLIKAENYLQSSLEIRRKLDSIRSNKNSSTEIAWTCCNLAVCIACFQNRLDEAETLFKESLEIYYDLEQVIPGIEAPSIARTLSAYANALIAERPNEGLELYNSALQLNQTLEDKNPGVYSGEIENITKQIEKATNISLR